MELAETFPSQIVCDWMGNSAAAARKHCYQTTDENFDRAVEAASKGKQNPKQHPVELGLLDSQAESKNREIAWENESVQVGAIQEADGVALNAYCLRISHGYTTTRWRNRFRITGVSRQRKCWNARRRTGQLERRIVRSANVLVGDLIERTLAGKERTQIVGVMGMLANPRLLIG